MPPRRPLPDLVLISVFKALTPNDQLKAAEMSPRCAILVRAANRPVKMLIIRSSSYFDVEWTKDHLNSFSLASLPVMKLLPVGGMSFHDNPMTTTRLSKWNCLVVNVNQLLDQSTVEQIVNAFSAVTDLMVKMHFFLCENLIALLQRPQWANQLTNLGVFGTKLQIDPSTNHRLIAVINQCLPALQYLAVDWYIYGGLCLPHLPIVAQLKVISIGLYSCGDAPTSLVAFLHSLFSGDDHPSPAAFLQSLHSCKDYPSLAAFLQSLETHAANNVDLQVHLHGSCPEIESSFFTLSEPFRTRIVRCDFKFQLDWASDDVLRFCRQLPSLPSLSVSFPEAPQLGALFTALSQFPQLVHLKMDLDWTEYEVEDEHSEQPQPFRRPMAQLTSVQALELRLHIDSHSQVQWSNLSVALPRLQAMYIQEFDCQSCGIWFDDQGNHSEDAKPNSPAALKCLRATLPLLHPGVPHERIILGGDETFTTLKQLLSA